VLSASINAALALAVFKLLWSSPVYADNHIHFQLRKRTKDALTMLVQATAKTAMKAMVSQSIWSSLGRDPSLKRRCETDALVCSKLNSVLFWTTVYRGLVHAPIARRQRIANRVACWSRRRRRGGQLAEQIDDPLHGLRDTFPIRGNAAVL